MTPKSEQKTKKLSILLVDDERDICVVYSDLLTMHGFAVTPGHSPSEVLQSFKKGEYDLAILDVKMPHMNGYELYEKLRAVDGELRVIFMTAYYLSDPSFQERHPELGKANFMIKPLDVDQLMETISDMMISDASTLRT